MMKRLLKLMAARAGLQLRRLPDASIPRLELLSYDGSDIQLHFWIANQHTERWLRDGRIHRSAELDFLARHAMQGATVVDVGAHHGIDTLLLSRWVGPTGQVFSFEASPDNCLVLAANIGSNRASNCTLVPAAASDSPGTVEIENESISVRGVLSRSVVAITLDDYFSDGIKPTLVKIDVEGFEMKVLRGATSLLELRPALALELHTELLAQYGDRIEHLFHLVPTDAYDIHMMCRPDWQTTTRISGANEIPRSGVVNLLMSPR